jgi:hypothetical protein
MMLCISSPSNVGNTSTDVGDDAALLKMLEVEPEFFGDCK